MIPLAVAVLGGLVSALAFPRFGPGILILPGIALFLWALRQVESRRRGFVVGMAYGFVFFMGAMWWSIELGLIALIPLALVQSLWFGGLGSVMAGFRRFSGQNWVVAVTGLWAVIEFARYHFPFSGLEWGGAGYALSSIGVVREGASIIGTSGWTVLVVALAAALVFLRDRSERWLSLAVIGAIVVVVGAGVADRPPSISDPDDLVRVAIVQGSTPCPYEKCPPDERLRTFQLHLNLTKQIAAGSVDLVVWAEGSTGSSNADPVLNPEIGAAIGAESARIGAWILVGSDRPVSSEEWINANVVFDDQGRIVGEYRKQQGVPFGEFIPLRPLFEWIPDLSQVPRDMIPGDGPVVFDAPHFALGSVISFEGSFSRFAREHVRAGADLVVVATNEGSYGMTAVSDQLIGMTRMRAAELGVPVVHAAVTGKSVVIDRSGAFASDTSGLGHAEIVKGSVAPGVPTLYARLGDWMMYLAAGAAVVVVWRGRKLLVSSPEDV